MENFPNNELEQFYADLESTQTLDYGQMPVDEWPIMQIGKTLFLSVVVGPEVYA